MSNKMIRALKLFVIFATFLCLLVPIYTVAIQKSAVVNFYLKGETYKIVEGNSSQSEDTEYYKTLFNDTQSLAEYSKQVSQEVESEGLVLLTNNGALPLDADSKISLFAQGSVSLNYSSTGSSAASGDYASLRDALESKNFIVNDQLWNWYLNNGYRRSSFNVGNVKTYMVNEAPWSSVASAVGDSFSSYGDAAIVVFSRDSGEGFDVSTRNSDGEDGSYLSITDNELELLEQLTILKSNNVFSSIIVLLNSALPIELDFLYRESISIDASLWIGNVGMSGVFGVAEALCGDVNPSGRLTDTYSRDNFSSPAMASWIYEEDGVFAQKYENASDYSLNTTQQFYGVYVEGIYVGYRYYETRYEDYIIGRQNTGNFDYDEKVAFPFGYGKSYTEFEYSNFTIVNETDDAYIVSLKVTNIGSIAGKEVVQIYVQKPYNPVGNVEVASVELVGFAKTAILNAGSSETVLINVRKDSLKSYDSENAQTYILSRGDYYLSVGYNAHNALNNILAAKGYSPSNTDGRMSEEGMSALAKKVLTLSNNDVTTYSRSTETGITITNKLDSYDINRYENKGMNSVTYLSRSNWEGTWPIARINLQISNATMYNDLTSNKQINDNETWSHFYAVQNGLTAIMLRGLDYDNPAWDRLLDQMTYEEQALLITNGAFGTNAFMSIGMPGTKASDGPTGVIKSITGSAMPGQGVWASTFNLELIEEVGRVLGEDARLNQLDTMYAPGINIHRTPFGGRANEYFSEDPFLTAMAAVSEVKGMQEKGVIAVLKHYAFNDQESARNGISIWLNEQSAREIYLLPFEYTMKPSMGSAYGAMSAFNRAGTEWVGASRILQMDIARGEWDYKGYFITDMAEANGLLYMTYDDGIFNGTDLFLGNGSKTALASLRNNIAFRNRVREAAHRVLYVNTNYSAAMNGLSSTSHIVEIMPWWQLTLLSFIGVPSLISVVSLGFWVYYLIKIPTKKTKSN